MGAATNNLRVRRRHGGNAILEMALVLPTLLILAMGMVEYGQYLYLKQAFEAAARDGCRMAIRTTTTQAAVALAITTTLAQSGVTVNSAWVKYYWVTTGGNVAVTDVTTIPAGNGVLVVITAPYSTLPNAVRPLSSMVPAAGIGTGKSITGTCNMVHE